MMPPPLPRIRQAKGEEHGKQRMAAHPFIARLAKSFDISGAADHDKMRK